MSLRGFVPWVRPHVSPVIGKFVRFILPCLIVLVTCSLPALGEEYYKIYSNAVEYIAWTEDQSGHLSGQYQAEIMDPSDRTKLTRQNASFTGIRNGSSVSITFNLLSEFPEQTWTGTVSSRSLALVRPNGDTISRDVFLAGTFDDFQSASLKLSQQVYAARTASALNAATMSMLKSFTNGATAANNDIAILKQVFDHPASTHGLRWQYEQNLAQMQSDWATVQNENIGSLTCQQMYAVQQQLYGVQQDWYRIQQDTYTRQSLMQHSEAAINDIGAEVVQASNVWPALNASQTRQLITQSGFTLGSSEDFYHWKYAALAFQKHFRNEYSSVNNTLDNFENQAKTISLKEQALLNALTCS